MVTRIALVGASGKLGRVIDGTIATMDGYEVTARIGSQDDFSAFADADLVVDSSTPAISPAVVRAAAAAGVNVLVATSGWSAERIAEVRTDVEASGIGMVVIPNFSLGSVLGTALAQIAAPFFEFAEIIEAHRDSKIDSPSGTAVRTAELIAQARGIPVAAPHADQRARGQQVASVPVHSLRRPGVLARQEVILSGPGESLSIVHDTVEPAAAYAPGIRIAVPAALSATGIVVGLDAFISIGVDVAGESA